MESAPVGPADSAMSAPAAPEDSEPGEPVGLGDSAPGEPVGPADSDPAELAGLLLAVGTPALRREDVATAVLTPEESGPRAVIRIVTPACGVRCCGPTSIRLKNISK